MFASARINLTLWYVAIIMLISFFFSLAFYRASTIEVSRILTRIEMDEQRQELGLMQHRNRAFDFPSIEELETIKARIRFNLLILNGFILLSGGGASYVLAGKTLKPIQAMVEEQQQFISDASHELRTPIATLRAEMESQLLEQKISDKQARQLITSNLEEVAALQSLSNDLLTLMKLHGASGRAKREVIAIDAVLKKSIEKLHILAQKKSITVKSMIKPAMIRGNARQLQQVFMSLIENAVKYSDAQTTISITGKKNAQAKYEISIEDKGVGIAAKDLPHIFGRFYRSQESRSDDGFGLGLSIAKGIVDGHDGSITVTSTLGKGSTFLVRLPLAKQ